MAFGSLGTIWAEIGLDLKKLDAGLMQAQTKLASADKSISVMGQKLTTNSTKLMATGGLMVGAVAGVGTAAVKMASDFDTSMRNVNSITKLSEQELGKLSKQVVDLSKKFPQSAKTLAEGLYDISSSGFQGAEGMKVLEASAKAASAGLTDTSTAAKGITAVLNAYTMSADKASDIADTMFATVDKGVITFEELSSQIGEVVGTANLANINFNELSGALAYMTTKGIDAAEATTSLNRLILSIIDPSKALAEVLREAGFESGEMALQQIGLVGVLELMEKASGGSLTKLQEMTPEMRALKAAGALLGSGIEELNGFMSTFGDTTGYATRALEEQQKSLSYQLSILKNDISAIGISLGSELLPSITSATTSISKWISENEELAAGLVKLAGGGLAGTGLLLLTAGAIGKIRAAIIALNATPFGLASAGLAGSITAMIGILGMYTTAMYNAGNANEEIYKKNKELEKAENDLVIAEKNRQVVLEGKNQTLRAATEEEQNHLREIELTAQSYKDYQDRENEAKEAILGHTEATEENTLKITENKIALMDNEAVISKLMETYGLTKEAAEQYAKSEGLLKSTTEETTGAIDEQKQSVDELIASLYKLYNLNQDTTEAVWNFEDALASYNEVLKDSNSTERDRQKALFAVQDAYEQSLVSMMREYEAVGNNTKRIEELQEQYVITGLKAVQSGAISETSFIEMAKQFDISSGEIIKWAKDMGITLDEATRDRIIHLGLETSGFDSSLSVALNRLNALDRRMGLSYAMGGIVGIPQADYGMVIPQTGREIPIIAHEGEMILNSSQQNNLIDALWGVANGKSYGASINNNFYISELVVREEADIDRIANELYQKQHTKQIGVGIR